MIVNVIPLAGNGQRFVDGGYDLPKPLIDVDGEQMIFRAFGSLPNAQKNVFICRADHINKYQIDELIQSKVENSIIISDEKPEGQASTTYKIKDVVDREDVVNIGACDNAMLYDIEKYNKFLEDDNIDFFVWTFRNYSGVNYNPEQYSYCVINKTDDVQRMSLKKSISDTPINDHCLVGAFTFKKVGDFYDAYNELIADNNTINGEFYIDSIVDYCIRKGLKGKVFEVDKYIGFGTPNDLKTYMYWSEYFKNNV